MAPNKNELKGYYDDLPTDGGFDSLCKMNVPTDLSGQTVLDVGCRRGQGIYKLSAAVGQAGHAIGTDWRPAFIERARAGVPHALEKNGLSESNIELGVAYPERLSDAGVAPASVDLAFLNGVLNLLFDPQEALDEVARALKPGGRLVCQTVVADGPRDGGVIERARALGNVVQAAPSRETFERWLADAGFDLQTLEVSNLRPIDITAAVDDDTIAPTVDAKEDVTFTNATFELRKLSNTD